MPEVPHLTTALTGPLLEIERKFLDQQTAIEAWFRQQWESSIPPLTCSVDLRNAGFKLAGVDTNLFPAGFNNLSRELISLSIQAAQAVLSHYYPGCTKILLIPESHTRHVYYYQSLAALKEILKKAGYEVRIGSIIEGLKEAKTIPLPDQTEITLEPVIRNENRLVLEDFNPCIIVLNNDLSGGIPPILENLKQKIAPALALGWSQRHKSSHFQFAKEINETFCQAFGLDPWLINPLFRVCDQIDFVNREGETCLMKQIDELLQAIQAKYDEYNIKQRPFVVVKADSGTYGMGILMVKSSEEIQQLNRKQRAKMTTLKGSQKLNRVIIQEGVYSFETCGKEGAVAEPVVYMLGNHVVGGFYRVHTARGSDENLNAPGMHFEPLAFAEPGNHPEISTDNSESVNRFYAYGVVARLALLAAAKEAAAAEANITKE